MVLLRSGQRWFGVEADSVREVVATESVTRVPSLPPHVLGVSLVHGRLLPVVDLSPLVGWVHADETAVMQSRLVVVRSGITEVGVIADKTRGVLELPQPEPMPDTAEHAAFVTGEVRWDDQMVCVIDRPALIAAVKAEAAQR